MRNEGDDRGVTVSDHEPGQASEAGKLTLRNARTAA
jgi:hypothetical protein